jgi:hypothetical protein
VQVPVAEDVDEDELLLLDDEEDDDELLEEDELDTLTEVPPDEPPPQAASALVESAEAPRNHMALRRDGRAETIKSSRLPSSLWAGSLV